MLITVKTKSLKNVGIKEIISICQQSMAAPVHSFIMVVPKCWESNESENGFILSEQIYTVIQLKV